jgi:hypothetical protein
MFLNSANAGVNSGKILTLHFIETSSSCEESKHAKCVQYIIVIPKSIFLFAFHCFPLVIDPIQQLFQFFTESNGWKVSLIYLEFTVDAPVEARRCFVARFIGYVNWGYIRLSSCCRYRSVARFKMVYKVSS